MNSPSISNRFLFSFKLMLVFAMFLLSASAASAATIYSNSATGNDTTGDGSSGNPYATFHKAYTVAQSGDSIDLAGTFTWTNAGETGDVATTGYTLSKNLTITGQSSNQTFVQAATASTTADRRVFTIASGAVITMSKLNIRHGRLTSTSYYGGGISNSGTLTITDSEINNNTGGAGGGGIDNVATTTARRISVYNNTVTYQGGGVLNNYNIAAGGYFVLENSTIYNNRQTSTSAYLNGAGVHVRGGSMALTNNTITGNVGQGSGGLGMETTGTVYLMNNLIAGNTSQTYGSTYNDLKKDSGTIVDNGYNIIGQPGGYTLAATGDWSDTNVDGTFVLYSVGTTGTLNLDTGASVNDNATTTPTWAVLASSIAINNGSTGSNGATSTVPTLDQRGAGRSGNTDIGSFEFSGTGLTIAAPSSQATSVVFSSVLYKQMVVGWTAGNGSRRTVFMKAASSGTASPVDGTSYTASTVFGSGTQIGSSGWYTIYDGVHTSGSITVTGLTQGTTYSVQVFEYNGIASGASVYQTASASGNPATQQSHAVVTLYANSSTGNDTTGSGTSGAPYATFHKAYTIAEAGDTISLTGTFTWTDAAETGDATTSGYTIGKDLIITGTGPDQTIVQAATASTTGDRRVFTIATSVSSTITNLTIQNGRMSDWGGGIKNSGTLTLRHVDVVGNSSTGNGGGGLANYATAVVERSSFRNNTGYYQGGGIVNIATTANLTLTNSTVYDNRQQSSVAYTSGGGINIRYGTVTITNCTIAYNSSYSNGGGLYLDDSTGVLYLKNTIIAQNIQRSGSTGSDFGKYASATMNDNGSNIVGRSNGYTFSATGDWTDTDNNGTWTAAAGGSGSLYLDTSLAYNGNAYKTYTLALTSGSSIAVDAASATANNSIAIPTTDQRVATRSSAADIGSYEYGGGGLDTTPPTVTLDLPTDGATIRGSAIGLSATASDDTEVAGVKFYVNNRLVGSEDITAPYSMVWNSLAATSSGTKVVLAVARDTNNNYTTSTARTVTLSNQPTPATVTASTSVSAATISWSTPVEGSSRMFFGFVTGLASSTPEANTATRVTSHSADITGLPSCAVYKYYTVSKNEADEIATSTQSTFKTGGCSGNASILANNEDDVTVASGGVLTQGVLSLTIPAAFTATSSQATFQANKLDGSTFFSNITSPTGKNRVGSTVYALSAYTDTATELSTFDQPLTVTLSYEDSDVSGLNESSLKIQRYDDTTWTELSSCTVDTAANTISCTTSHFSDFAIFGDTAASTSASSPTSGTGGERFMLGCIDPAASNYSPVAYGTGTALCTYAPEIKNQEAPSDTPPAEQVVPPPVPTSSYHFVRDLSFGMQGDDVRALQQMLFERGFYTSTTTSNYFGKLTRDALIAFQKANNIKPSVGYFGSVTRTAFDRPSVQPQSAPLQVASLVFTRDLKMGTTGQDVSRLQQFLIRAKYAIPSGATGIFGKQTRDALAAFQRDNAIDPAVGYLGVKTRQKLSEYPAELR